MATAALPLSPARNIFPQPTERLEGYGQALSEAGIPLDPTLIQRCPFRVESGYAAADALLQQAQPPTAFFAANNFLTIGVLAAIRNRGLVVPRDIAVVDFDEIPQIALVLPFLTVAAQAVQEIGRQGATDKLNLPAAGLERRQSRSAEGQ